MLRIEPVFPTNCSTSLDRFLSAVHRRQVVLRIVERAGVGMLGASVIATVLVGVALWRGENAWTIAGATLVAGALIGALWGAMHRPSTLSAASEADRQLRTADLMATAWLSREQASSDPWAQTVVALAADLCRHHRPTDVMLRRLNGRAWSGIALAVAFVGVLAALSSGSPEAVAARANAARDATPERRRDNDAAQRPIVELAVASEQRQHRTDLSPEDPSKPGDASGNDAQEQPAAAETHPDARDAHPPAGADSSAGSGQGRAESKAPASTLEQPPALLREGEHLSTESTSRKDGRRPAAGVGHEANGSEQVDDTTLAGGIVEPGRQAGSPSTPGLADVWPQAVESARRDLAAGRVPDHARDLVRDYFDPDAARP